jgi:hypothetical protein
MRVSKAQMATLDIWQCAPEPVGRVDAVDPALEDRGAAIDVLRVGAVGLGSARR